MGYWNYAPYVNVGQKKALARRQLDQLRKQDPDVQPVCIEGRAVARTWWGKSWNANLERYADYSNRIGRGRSYVCNGMVLDLRIAPGHVKAVVQGTQDDPYEVAIRIAEIPKNRWKKIRDACQGHFDSLPELLEGRFPAALADIFMARGEGLFPSPKEISFSCSCPDWASMCKHVAAALYGIGARLDQDPLLFFTLRHADVNLLISHAMKEKTRQLLDKAGRKSARIIAEADLGNMFGIELDEPAKGSGRRPVKPSRPEPVPEPSAKTSRKSTTSAAQPSGKPRKKTAATLSKTARKPADSRPESRKKQPPPSKKPRKTETPIAAAARKKSVKRIHVPSPMSAADIVEQVIRKSRKGVRVEDIAAKTGLESKQIYNTLYRLKKKGSIVTPERGLFRKA